MKNKIFILVIVTVVLLMGVVFRKGCHRDNNPPVESLQVEEPVKSPAPMSVVEEVPMVLPKPTPRRVPPKATTSAPKPEAALPMTVPAIELHKELIPKNVEIVRVYYANSLQGPGDIIEFDINGSGFTSEFEGMIQVISGHPDVEIKNLKLITPNQIHGQLVISKKATTKISFPQILINRKVVFQAPDPFAVVRPGEVLNLIFTEMGESGRSGRFRVFTNLTPELFKGFRVSVSTPSIQILNLTPSYPFIVDGEILIGAPIGGIYDLEVNLGKKTLWKREGIIRVVQPNIGQSGLAQRLVAKEEFLRPGDTVDFILQGSGFRPEDSQLLTVHLKEGVPVTSTFRFVAPGRMDLVVGLPNDIQPNTYTVILSAGPTVLLETPRAFTVVGANWMRGFQLSPPLKPGDEGNLILMGRDLSASFIEKIKIEVDEPALEISKLIWKKEDRAEASIRVGQEVKPGDYLLHLTIDGESRTPEMGSIIQIQSR